MKKKYANLIVPNDNVVTSVADIDENDVFNVIIGDREKTFASNHNVPFGHKIAIQEIKKGGEIVKYGHVIGIASIDIKVGDWVHIHNVMDNYEVR